MSRVDCFLSLWTDWHRGKLALPNQYSPLPRRKDTSVVRGASTSRCMSVRLGPANLTRPDKKLGDSFYSYLTQGLRYMEFHRGYL